MRRTVEVSIALRNSELDANAYEAHAFSESISVYIG